MLVGVCEKSHPSYREDNENMFNSKSHCSNDIIGFMKAGSHFGNDLGEGFYDYGRKRICHLVCRQPTLVGVIS
jgi:hypothetical protein